MKRILAPTMMALFSASTVAQALPPVQETQETSGWLAESSQFTEDMSGVVVWASPIGRLESPDSRAVVTAVALEDRATEEITRGVRIDLIHRQPNPDCNLRFAAHARLCAEEGAAIFIDENELMRVRDDVDRGNAAGNLIYSWRSGVGNALTSGLTIGGYTFAGSERTELATIIERGIDELASAPR